MIDAMNTSLAATVELAEFSQEKIQPRLDALKKATQDFEAIFLHQLLKLMRDASPKSDLFESGFARGVYEDMRDEQLAKEMAANNTLGFADLLYQDTKDLVITEVMNEYTQSKAE